MTEHGMVIDETFCGTSSPIDKLPSTNSGQEVAPYSIAAKLKWTIAHGGFQVKHEIGEAESRSPL